MPKYVSIIKASELTGISYVTLFKYANDGKLRVIKDTQGKKVDIEYLYGKLDRIRKVRNYLHECYYKLETEFKNINRLSVHIFSVVGGKHRQVWYDLFSKVLFNINRERGYVMKLTKHELMFYRYCRKNKIGV